jgi:hypothetical protein
VRRRVAAWEAELWGTPLSMVGATVAAVPSVWLEAKQSDWQPTPVMGVRADVPLLRAFGIGNNVGSHPSESLLDPAQAPRLCSSWPGHQPPIRTASRRSPPSFARSRWLATSTPPAVTSCAGLTGSPATTDGYSLPVHPISHERHPEWFFQAPSRLSGCRDPGAGEITRSVSWCHAWVRRTRWLVAHCVAHRGDDGLAYVACWIRRWSESGAR